MVIDMNPNARKQKEAEKRLSRPDDEIKEDLLKKLRGESVSIISLAYYYAKALEETGADITKRWQTATEQNIILQHVFNKGYEEGLSKGRELEREKQNNKGINNTIGSGLNSQIGDNTV